jgi:hypothetical protein
MKKLFVLLVTAFLVSSCGTEKSRIEPVATPSTPKPTEEPMSYNFQEYDFYSEEEFIEYVLNERGEILDEHREFDKNNPLTHTRYYKLKNPPEGAIISSIYLGVEVSVTYDTQHNDAGDYKYIKIRYSPYYSFDIEEDGLWNRGVRHESHIFELGDIKYYVHKASHTWTAEWYNEDGYYMSAAFPYRFTAEEVLGYISDLERVEIG